MLSAYSVLGLMEMEFELLLVLLAILLNPSFLPPLGYLPIERLLAHEQLSLLRNFTHLNHYKSIIYLSRDENKLQL